VKDLARSFSPQTTPHTETAKKKQKKGKKASLCLIFQTQREKITPLHNTLFVQKLIKIIELFTFLMASSGEPTAVTIIDNTNRKSLLGIRKGRERVRSIYEFMMELPDQSSEEIENLIAACEDYISVNDSVDPLMYNMSRSDPKGLYAILQAPFEAPDYQLFASSPEEALMLEEAAVRLGIRDPVRYLTRSVFNTDQQFLADRMVLLRECADKVETPYARFIRSNPDYATGDHPALDSGCGRTVSAEPTPDHIGEEPDTTEDGMGHADPPEKS
jgi:uncharacterized protein YcgL (UPF0745 family)